MSKLITDAIELSGGTNLSLPTTRPDNTILKTSSNSLTFANLPTRDLKTVWDYRVDGPSNFYYVFETSPDKLAGVFFEVENIMSPTSGSRPSARLTNSAGNRRNYSSTISTQVAHGAGWEYQNHVSETDIPILPSTGSNFNESTQASAEDPKFQHSGQAFILFNGNHTSLTSGTGNVVWQHFGWGMSRRFNSPQGVFKASGSHVSNSFGSVTNSSDHDALDVTQMFISTSNTVSGTIRIAEIKRADT